MNRKYQKYITKMFLVYGKHGLRGLYNAILNKIKFAILPFVYRNRTLSNFYNPKLKTAFLELTNNCNLRCEMCDWQSKRRTGYISRQLFESCINQFSEMKLDALNLQFGGESLLHSDFNDLLKYAIHKRNKGKIGSVGLTNNGMLFSQSIADLFVSLNVDWVNFSLDGLGPINDKIRLGSKYSVIEKNIKYLIAKRGSSKKPKIILNMVDHGKTEDEKLEFYRAWVDVVDEIALIPSILPDNTLENKDVISKNLNTIPPPASCTIPLETMIVCWDGRVLGCCFDSNIKLVLGDATKDSIKQIWNGSKYQRLRKATLTNTFSCDSPCYKCDFWKINFEYKIEPILDGKATIEYDYMYRRIRKTLGN